MLRETGQMLQVGEIVEKKSKYAMILELNPKLVMSCRESRIKIKHQIKLVSILVQSGVLKLSER